MNETLELLLNDEIDNDSGTPTKGKGKAAFEFQILPLKQGKVFKALNKQNGPNVCWDADSIF